MITDDGCWADYRVSAARASGRPCLFLDRDGVLIEDTGYPSDPNAVILIPETLDLVRRANQRDFVVGIVTNQSGIGRGYFDWTAFEAVQDRIDQALSAIDAHIDFTLACPHHPDAVVPRYRHDDHPWRKPSPGMLDAAMATLGLSSALSVMLGDRPSDMDAASAAGIPHRGLLTPDDRPTELGAWTGVSRRALHDWFSAIARR